MHRLLNVDILDIDYRCTYTYIDEYNNDIIVNEIESKEKGNQGQRRVQNSFQRGRFFLGWAEKEVEPLTKLLSI